MIEPKIIHQAESLLQQKVAKYLSLDGGVNNRISKLYLANGNLVVLKKYGDFNGKSCKQRMNREFQGLSYLWDNGERRIPEPLHRNDSFCFAIYEFIQGESLCGRAINQQELVEILSFIASLKANSCIYPKEKLLPAADSCLSMESNWDNLSKRYEKFKQLLDDGSICRKFLNEEFVPIYDCLNPHSVKEKKYWKSLSAILSPSDLGFHNMILTKSNRIIFLDFEYFGWDDPAKMVVDFLLHPQNQLPWDLKQFFLDGVYKIFREDHYFKKRIKIIYPLHCLKWVLLILNDFLPGARERYCFSGSKEGWSELLSLQIKKAQRMLTQIRNNERIYS